MPNIISKDKIRQVVESATNGKITVLYDIYGHPSYMYVLPKFNIEDVDPTADDNGENGVLDTGVHPAFIIDSSNNEVDEIFIGVFESCTVQSNEYKVGCSLPNMIPESQVSLNKADTTRARDLAHDKGDGWHVMTNWEWAAILLYSFKNIHVCRGSGENGVGYLFDHERGKLVDEELVDFTPERMIYTGSGPLSWRHNGIYNGVDNLFGNIPSWVDGVKLSKEDGGEPQGRILMPPSNWFDLDSYPESSWSDMEAGYHYDGEMRYKDNLSYATDVAIWKEFSRTNGYTDNVTSTNQQLLMAACLDPYPVSNAVNDKLKEREKEPADGSIMFTSFSDSDDEKYLKRGGYSLQHDPTSHKNNMGPFSGTFQSDNNYTEDSGFRLAYIPI